MRRKVEELENENENSKRQIEQLHDKLRSSSFTPLKIGIKNLVNDSDTVNNKTKSIMPKLRYLFIKILH